MKRIALFLCLSVVIAATHSFAQERRYDHQASRQLEALAVAKFPTVVKSILVEDRQAPASAVVNVTLHKCATEPELRGLASLLRPAFQPSRYLFIFYTLPGTAIGNGAWASTHFDPALNVRIMGLTEDQEAKLRAVAQPTNAKIVGVWYTSMPSLLNGRLTIYTLGNKAFYEWKYLDGSANQNSLRITKIGNRTRYDERNDRGDHYIVEQDGTLRIGDKENGVFATVTLKQ